MSGKVITGRITSYRALDITPGTRATVESLPEATRGGTVNVEYLPLQDALVCTLRTALKGRARRGRLYLAGYAESAQTAGVWGTQALTPANAFMDALLARFGANGSSANWTVGVISRQEDNVVRTAPDFEALTGFTVRDIVRAQRRRQRGKGA